MTNPQNIEKKYKLNLKFFPKQCCALRGSYGLTVKVTGGFDWGAFTSQKSCLWRSPNAFSLRRVGENGCSEKVLDGGVLACAPCRFSEIEGTQVLIFLQLPLDHHGPVSKLSLTRKHWSSYTGPFNWGEALCAGEKVKRSMEDQNYGSHFNLLRVSFMSNRSRCSMHGVHVDSVSCQIALAVAPCRFFNLVMDAETWIRRRGSCKGS